MFLLGLFLAMNVALGAALLSERTLRILFAVLTLLAGVWLIVGHLQAPGHEVVSLLLVGVLLAGTFGGGGVAVLALPVGLLAPLALASSGGVALAVHNHWHTASTLLLGLGVALALRQAWSLAEASSSRWARPALLTALTAAPSAFFLMTTPATGLRAGNVLLPMATPTGQEARLVVLQDGGANSWPWLEPLQFALPVGLALLGMVVLLAFAARPGFLRHRIIMAVVALVLLVVWGFVAIASPGALAPLREVDPELVVAAIRPAFVPADAMAYLSPEWDTWQMSRAALALWFGVGAWLAASLLLVTRAPLPAGAVPRETAALAPIVLLIAALMLAEAWSLQALGVASQMGAPGLVFALTALVACATLLGERLRFAMWLVVAAVSSSWLLAFVAEKVIA